LTREELDRLLEVLALEEGPRTELPRTAVENYIHGRAGAEEQARVESAMASSGAFREEVLALAAAAGRGEEFDALQAPRAPRRREAFAGTSPGHPRAWRRRPTVLAFCGLVALALLWVLSPLPPSLPRAPLPLYAVSLDRRLTDEQFERTVQRSADGAQPLPAARNMRDAALLSFFRAIQWKDGEFTIHPVSPETGGQKPYRLDLELHRGKATLPWPHHVLLPQGAEEPHTAILVFPDLLLYWVDSTTWTGRAGLSQRPGQSLFLVVAYRLGNQQYRASAPTRIPPP